MSGSHDEFFYSGMSDSDWQRLHTRVIPNPLPLEEFKNILTTGKLQDRYLAKDLHKIMQELRDLLREHGELREAAIFPLVGKKHELSRAAAAAVRVIDAHRERMPTLRRSPGAVPVASSSDAQQAPPEREASMSPVLDGAADTPSNRPSITSDATSMPPLMPSRAADSISPRRSTRVPPLVGHMDASETSLLSGSSVNTGASSLSGLPSSSLASTAHLQPPTWQRERAVPRGDSSDRAIASSRGSVMQASSTSTSSLAGATITAGAPSTGDPSVPAISASTAKELAQLNETAPPFFQLLNVIRRLQIRFGSSRLTFEVPVQYAEAVHSRRLRVYLIPLRHPNVPARWPAAKEIVVYVNEQCVMTPWKRAWPERKQEVAKSYLPLDITYLLSRNVLTQRVQVDIFHKEYLSPAIVAVVLPLTLPEVTESMLQSRLTCRSVEQARQGLRELQQHQRNPSLMPRDTVSRALPQNHSAVQRVYGAIMAEDEDEDGIEVDDPIITTKCPISQMPLSVPVRGNRCSHLQCVDLEAFLVSCHKGCYWNCTLCDAEMRPQQVQIDTVLWAYLDTFASADDYPNYLRLSAQPAPDGGVSYVWHPSSRPGEDVDVISDDEDENEAEGEEGSDRDTQPPSPAPMVSSSLPMDAGVIADDRGRKRSRASSADDQLGTADDPIEL